jgi:hypothetical protein
MPMRDSIFEKSDELAKLWPATHKELQNVGEVLPSDFDKR